MGYVKAMRAVVGQLRMPAILLALFCVLVAGLAVVDCARRGLSPRQLEMVQEGMTRAQVEAILGKALQKEPIPYPTDKPGEWIEFKVYGDPQNGCAMVFFSD